MPRTRKVHRKDANEDEIVEALEKLGATVKSLSGKDIPDLLVGWRGRNYLFEVKTPKGKLKDGQEKFLREWEGQCVVVRTPAEALNLLALHQMGREWKFEN